MRHWERLFVCFAVGAAAIVLLRLLFPSNTGAFLAATAACGVIFFLGWSYWREGAHESSRAGDDLYYLGLLFTLVSLMYALIALFILSPGGDIDERTNTLIGNFGIALISTVFGILGRILLQGQAAGSTENQSQTSSSAAEEPFDATREALEELRLQVRYATDAFRHFARVTTEQAEENRVHMQHQIEQSTERMNEEARNSLLENQAAWLETLKTIGAQNATMLGHIQEEVTLSTQRTETAWQDIARHAHKTSITARQSLDSMVKEMASMLEAMSELNGTLPPLSKGMVAVTDNVRDMGKTTVNVVGDLSARATEIINAHDALAQSAKKYQKDCSQALRESTELAAKTLTDEMDACIQAVRRLAAATNGQQDQRQPPKPWARRILRRQPASGGGGQAKATSSRLMAGRRR